MYSLKVLIFQNEYNKKDFKGFKSTLKPRETLFQAPFIPHILKHNSYPCIHSLALDLLQNLLKSA